jgi:hypothetical protein
VDDPERHVHPEQAGRDEKAWGVNSKDPKQIDSSKIGDGGADDDDVNPDVAGMIGTTNDVP